MAAAFLKDEWELVDPKDPLRWRRKDHPEDGILTLTEGGMTFEEYCAKRARPAPEPRDIAAELDALKARIAQLEGEVTTMKASRELSGISG